MHFKLFNKTFLLLVLIAVLGSCAEKADPGSTIIPREQMIEILADLQIFESTHQILKDKNEDDVDAKRKAALYPEIYGVDSTTKSGNEVKPKFDMLKIYKWVFEHYQVTEKSFRESMDYYSNDPEEFESIYDEVLIRISEKQAEFTSS
jgi:hypothetical protein